MDKLKFLTIYSVTHLVTVLISVFAYGLYFVYVLGHQDSKFGTFGTVQFLVCLSFFPALATSITIFFANIFISKLVFINIKSSLTLGVISGIVVAATHKYILFNVDSLFPDQEILGYVTNFVIFGVLLAIVFSSPLLLSRLTSQGSNTPSAQDKH